MSIDAWHDDFTGAKNPSVDLFAQAFFSEGRIGGETDSPVTFRLRLRRAELIAFCDIEPVRIVRRTVLREKPKADAKAKLTKSHSTKTSASLAATANITKPTASVGAKDSAGSGEKIVIRSTVSLASIATHHMPDSDGNDRWLITPVGEPALQGPALDPGVPLFEMVDTRKDRSKGLPPSLRLEIHCRREDLEIFEIKLKDENLAERAMAKFGSAHRLKAAEAYIRTKLCEIGLEAGDLSNAFSRLTIARAIATPEKSRN